MNDESTQSSASAARRAAEAEFSEFHKTIFIRLRRYSSRILRQTEGGYDIAQEALATLWKQWDSVPADKRRAWVYRIAHNKAVDEIRKLAGRDATLEKLPKLPQTYDHDAAADLAAIESALAKFAPRERAAILLTKDGLTPREIAEVLGIKKDSVHSILTRARRKLRILLGRRKRNAHYEPSSNDLPSEGGSYK